MARPRKDQPRLDLSRIGRTGLPVWSGRVYDEELRELRDEHGRKILREMSEQDPIIGGILYGVEMLARQVSWTVIPAFKEDHERGEKAKEVSDFFDECLTDMAPTFGNTLSEILSMLVYGWSWLEILYKRREGLNVSDRLKSSRFDDGKVGWAGWAIRSQETLYEWKFNQDHSNVEGMEQWVPWEMNPEKNRVVVPRSKSLHFVTRSRRENPEGISMLRNAYRAWYMKKNIEAIEGIGIERDLAGLPVLWAPIELFAEDASDEQKALFTHLKGLVTGIKRDEEEGVLMPMAYLDEDGKQPSYKLELLSTGGERQFDTNAIINRYDERIAMSMLADFILMGHEAVGSFALSTTKTGIFSLAMSSILDIVTEEVNAQAFPKLCLLNGYDLELCPSLQHGQIDAADLGKLGTFLKDLFSAGMNVFPNPELEKKLLEMAGLPGDEGAGAFPLELDPTTGQPIPLQIDPLTGQRILQPKVPQIGPGGAPLPQQQTRPEDTPASKPGGSAARRAQTLTKGGRAAPAGRRNSRAASEPGKQRHFVPLATRVARVAEVLQDALTPEEYTEFLQATMAAGKFTKLEEKYQEWLLQVEAAE